MNYENILNNLKGILDIYNEENTLDNIYNSLTYLNKLEAIDNKYANYKQRIEDSYYSISDAIDELTKDLKYLDFDENELNQINDKLGIYSDFKRKYKKSTQEIIDYYEDIKKEINNIENYDDIINDLEKKVKIAFNKTLEIGKNIRTKRIELAKLLEKNILNQLQDLKLKNTRFSISFNELNNISFKPNGIDEVDFLISFNLGEPLKSLSKVASGGEISRLC